MVPRAVVSRVVSRSGSQAASAASVEQAKMMRLMDQGSSKELNERYGSISGCYHARVLAQPTPFGDYLLVEKLDGSEPGGDAAEVFRALVTGLERSVIIKRLDPDLAADPKLHARTREL